MKLYGKTIHAGILTITCLFVSLNGFFDVKKTNRFTSYNCQTSNIIVNITGDDNTVYIVNSCIFIAGATPTTKKIATNNFRQINLLEPQTVSFSELQRGIYYSPTEKPQNSYKIYLYATIDPVDELPQKIKSEYKQRDIKYALQIWQAAEFKSGLLANTTGVSQFYQLQTLPAKLDEEHDTITIYPNGQIVLVNDEGSITLPAQAIHN